MEILYPLSMVSIMISPMSSKVFWISSRKMLKSVPLCLRCTPMVKHGDLHLMKRNSASLMKTYGLADCLPHMALTLSVVMTACGM